MDPHDTFETKFSEAVVKATTFDIETAEATTAIKNLKILSECRPPQPDIEPAPPVPETAWGRFACTVAKVWDNETTRAVIKAGGALAGVGVVTYATIHKDHVIERQALAQAGQRPA
jgi:hypothetical protein